MDPAEPAGTSLSLLPTTSRIVDGRLYLDGIPASNLAGEHGTPLYVYDAATLREQARAALDAFQPLGARISFASKSCAIAAVSRVFKNLGLGLDVVSGGELEAGLRAGFDPADIHLHGNCKSRDELVMAAQLGIHAIVVDNLEEAIQLAAMAESMSRSTRVMLRVSLPLEAETHPHLQTSGRRSKFGVYRGSAEEKEILATLSGAEQLRLIGIHAHLGSQITSADIYRRAASQMAQFALELRATGYPIAEMSVGGGWAVPYFPGDPALEAAAIAAAVRPVMSEHGWLRLAVEPGRFLVARAGMALYRIGSVKRAGPRRIIAVDGGMGDNPRPALYGTRYTALVTDHCSEPPLGPVDVVGRYCETGDLLVRDVDLPAARAGDILAIPMSGAYHLSMASSYNLVPPPAAVMVDGGSHRLIARRATINDLLARDILAGE